jgi:hypothetical protein
MRVITVLLVALALLAASSMAIEISADRAVRAASGWIFRLVVVVLCCVVLCCVSVEVFGTISSCRSRVMPKVCLLRDLTRFRVVQCVGLWGCCPGFGRVRLHGRV